MDSNSECSGGSFTGALGWLASGVPGRAGDVGTEAYLDTMHLVLAALDGLGPASDAASPGNHSHQQTDGGPGVQTGDRKAEILTRMASLLLEPQKDRDT
ncbi:hypothetical protein TREES_T100001947 [Tupaia chinensis]|uniref:Uncharacterized protein n=1 Tax=Tupaia chinensis TaxID=246437 RepID=L9JGT6_TUPCH|nr:hypothetical protein TREES_T100001947 [Tupaia chinensis]